MSIGDRFRFGLGFTLGAAVASLVAWIPFLVLWGLLFASTQ